MGTLLGGTSFQRLGLSNQWTRDHDTGRQGVTKRRADRQVFKVPSLRNVARTGPYFHDGSCRDLGEAVRLMAWHQLGEGASDADVALIVGWLDTLTGELPQEGLSLRR